MHQEEKKGSVKQVILRYFSFYPWFILSMVLCVGTAMLYIRYTAPKYAANALILVKESPANSTSNGTRDLVDKALNGTSTNLQNDIMLLRSGGLMKRAMTKNEFNIDYYKVGNVLKTNIYTNAPFRLKVTGLNDSSQSVRFTITNLRPGGGAIQLDEKNSLQFSWDKEFSIGRNKMILSKTGSANVQNTQYEVVWKPLDQAVSSTARQFGVSMSSNDNTVIELNLVGENLEKNKAILDAVINEFIQANIEEKTRIAQSTINFIDDRLAMVSQQLNGVEGDLETYRDKSQVISQDQQTQQSLTSSDEVSKSLGGLQVQKQVVEMIKAYLGNPANQNSLVPSSMGISDPTLSSLVTRYNELQLTREREAPLNAPGSLVMKDLNSQIANLKNSLLESLNNFTASLQLQENNLRRQGAIYNQSLSAVPGKERSIQSIKRQQSITEGLYLYLLQRREESALSVSTVLSNYQQIDPASGYGPVEPNKSKILKFAFILGLLLPFGFIYLKDATNDKINSWEDITSKTTVPLIGEIGHIKTVKSLQLQEKNNAALEHEFRLIRTNLAAFYKQRGRSMILVTSSVSGEGKSTVSYNVAKLLAKSGKKVALLQFDLRRPNGSNWEANPGKGLSSFLNGETDALEDIYTISESDPNLHIFPAGPIELDPLDLLLTERLKYLFELLKYQYDHVIINTAPVTVASDAILLSEHVDVVIYVVRQRVTTKKQLELIEEFARSGKLGNMYLVMNDTKKGNRYGQNKYSQHYSLGKNYNNK